MSNWKLNSTIAKKLLSPNGLQGARPVVVISMIGVSLGLMVMFFSIAITGGYKNSIRDKMTSMGAHIRISNNDDNYSFEQKPFVLDTSMINELNAVPKITHIQYYATKVGVVKTDHQVEGIVLKGIDSSFNWDVFAPNIKEGKPLRFQDTIVSNEVMISSKLANRLQLKVGDKLRAYFVQEPPMQRSFIIAGIFETGMPEYDKNMALVDLRHVQTLNGWDSTQIGAIELFTNDFDHIDPLAVTVDEMLDYHYKAESIREIYPEIFEWISLFDTNVIVLILITMLVSSITIISTFFIIILEQTQKIGLLKAIGMTSKQILNIFLLVALYILLIGMAVGNIVSVGLGMLQYFFHFIKLNPETYYVDYIPIELNLPALAAINIGILIICVLVLILPARFITKRISPVSALRQE
ncbi:MAG: ABC transporter permease [Bacteroidales bacterium]|jgi:lipoprotein-releasing system permease protein|nr:ABC transporter permease [Bacteroidales bacterium]